jgi:hypothetical protein
MEPTSNPDNARQPRGLARFWPVHGMPAPVQRQSDEDDDAAEAAAEEARSVAEIGPTSEQPRIPDAPGHGVPAPHSASAQAAAAAQLAAERLSDPGRAGAALTSDTQMVALGSRRGFDGAQGWNGNQGGFPPVESERGHRNGDSAPRHGGAPVPNGLPPVAGHALPGSRSPFAPPAASASGPPSRPPSGSGESAPRPSFGPPAAGGPVPRSPFGRGAEPGASAPRPPFGPPASASGPPSPFAPAAPFPPASCTSDDDGVQAIPLGAAAASDDAPDAPSSRGAASVPVAGRRRSPQDHEQESGEETQNRKPEDHKEDADKVESRDAGEAGRVDDTPRPEAEATDRPGVNGRAMANGRAGSPSAGRAATGWASVPTSGIPTLSGTSGVATTSTPTSGLPSAGRSSGLTGGEPAAETAVASGTGGTTALPEAEAPAGPRRTDSDRPQTPAPRRSLSLEDAEVPMPRAGRRAAEEPVSDAPLRPGDVTLSQIMFWDEDAVGHFRSQWHEVKAEFVDDPVAALTRAHDLLTEAVNELTESLLAERDELDPLDGRTNPDTESMRMAMRGYREFLDRILAL